MPVGVLPLAIRPWPEDQVNLNAHLKILETEMCIIEYIAHHFRYLQLSTV